MKVSSNWFGTFTSSSKRTSSFVMGSKRIEYTPSAALYNTGHMRRWRSTSSRIGKRSTSWKELGNVEGSSNFLTWEWSKNNSITTFWLDPNISELTSSTIFKTSLSTFGLWYSFGTWKCTFGLDPEMEQSTSEASFKASLESHDFELTWMAPPPAFELISRLKRVPSDKTHETTNLLLTNLRRRSSCSQI